MRSSNLSKRMGMAVLYASSKLTVIEQIMVECHHLFQSRVNRKGNAQVIGSIFGRLS